MFHFLKKKYLLIFSKELLVIFFFLCSSLAFSQVYYSVDPSYLKGKTEQNNVLATYKAFYPDTSIVDLSNYFTRNFMGNTGLPSPDYILKYGTDQIGFRYFKTPYDNDRFDIDKIKYFRTKGPYAGLTGIAGTKRYEIFKMLFSHTYRDIVNITAGFQRYNTLGFYKRQQTYTNNFFLSSNYASKKSRLGYYLYILNNGNKNQENGGIQDGILTDSTSKLKKDLLNVNIRNADRANTEQKIMFNPWLKLNSKPDSVAKLNHYLQIKSEFINAKYSYTSTGVSDDDFYKNNYYDTVQTKDSSHVRKLRNDLSYSCLSHSKNIGLSFGYLNELTKAWQKKDTNFVNHIVHTEWVFRKELRVKDSLQKNKPLMETNLFFNYVLEGVNKGNYKLEGKWEWSANSIKRNRINIDALIEDRKADHMQNHWRSNHFIWDNNFKSIQQMQARLAYAFKDFQFSFLIQNISNYIYFDKEALPKQYANTITNLSASLSYTKILFKHLGFSVNYLYQSTNAPEIVRIPQNSAAVKLFYNTVMANNNLHLQIGTQLNVYDSFTAYAYMPSTQAYYLQDNFKTSPYPFLDLYLNVRIRPVSFFLKVENTLYGYAGSEYAFVPGYYQTDRAFRFGINWMFFD